MQMAKSNKKSNRHGSKKKVSWDAFETVKKKLFNSLRKSLKKNFQKTKSLNSFRILKLGTPQEVLRNGFLYM